MPNKQNAKKALRQAKKRTAHNLLIKKAYKKAIKEIAAAPVAEAKEKIRLAQKMLDKASKKGVIKKNTASRKLSRITKRANSAEKNK